MPLHGKIVVLHRSGGDGTEFPLTATCLFGRKPDCDIRIQLPQVSKEHCRIDINENKEVILTNLSSVNPTFVNGQALQQSERLKHGDLITIIDRSFRFEYPPPPTPKKRSSVGGKSEAASVDPHLKDTANSDNIQRSLEKTQELESKEDGSLLESKTASPFSDLYQMIKQSLDVKTPRKSSVSFLQTPSKLCTPKPESAVKNQGTPKKVQTPFPPVKKAQDADVSLPLTPKSAKKRRSVQLSAEQTESPAQEAKPTGTSSPCRNATPRKFTLNEAVEQVTTQSPKSPRRRSKETTSPASAKKPVASPAKTETTPKTTPKSSEKSKTKPKKRKSEELGGDLPTQEMKRKRVSFGGHLSPELFDKRLPPDSPLRKGATPRRSLSLYKPKQSLLRRASVIGLLQECARERKLLKSPKEKSPAKTKSSPKKSPKKSTSPRAQSPKSKTPSPGRKSTASTKSSPKSPKAQSPKAQSPAKKVQTPKATTPKSPSPAKKAASPKASSPKAQSPKVVKVTPAKSPVQHKAQTPKEKSQRKSTASTDGTPKQKSPNRTATPVTSPGQTPKVQGRFSVSRINTPSPVVEDAPTATPKIPLRRKSMKSSTKTTPALKSAAKVMRRKSGMMRSSMKVMTSWADIVRFGKTKVQAGVPTKAQVIKKTTKKKAAPKPQTPKRRLLDHVSTGHAASPATIVVGKAHRLRVAHSAGAPPKIVTNTAVLRKNMKMDEDLTGLSEMFKTPKNEKRRSRTSQADLSKSVIEPSVLNTPEETGEMVVSPMSVASTVKGRRYNTEAVQRLLNEEEAFASEFPSLDMPSETPKQSTEQKVHTPKTPKQKPPVPEGLTGVKRMMKTPKQKAEPVEDLKGKLLKTPKQKSEQQECLSAIKRIMKTPKEKATPIEDLSGKLLKTPKQRAQQQEECLTGIKRIMKTPKSKSEPVEDLRGKLLKTPKQPVEQPECLSAIKTLMKTPEQKVEQTESITSVKRSTRTPKEKIEPQESLTGVKRIMKTPKEKSEPIDDIRGRLLLTPKQKIEQQECLTGVKRIMASPKQKNEPVEDMVGVKRLMQTPKEKIQPVEKNFGIKRLMRSPRLRGNAPVEDFEGLEELMKEPVEEQIDAHTEETVKGDECAAVSEEVVDELKEAQKVTTMEEPVESESVSASLAQEVEIIPSVAASVLENSSVTKTSRGRRAKATEPTVDQPEEIVAPVKARRGRKLETSASKQTALSVSANAEEETAPEPTVKQRRGRLAKKLSKELHEEDQTVATTQPISESQSEEMLVSAAPEPPVVKPRRGRRNKADDVPTPSETAQTKQEITDVLPADNQEETAEKPAQGRKAKVTKPEEPELEPASVAPDTKDVSEEAVAPVRGRRGKKIDAPVTSTVRQRRGRAAKSEENIEEAAESISEHLEDKTCNPETTEATVQDKPSAPTKGAAQEKTRRGKQIKASVEPSQAEPEIIPIEREQPVDEAKPVEDQPKKKPQRGRRGKTQAQPPQPETSAVEDDRPSVSEAVKDIQVQPEPTLKTRRGRHAKSTVEPEEPQQPEVTTVEGETVEDIQVQPEPTLKTRRGRHAKTTVETQEPEMTTAQGETEEQAAPAEKPKRGGRTKTEVTQAPVQGKRSRTVKLEKEKAVPEQQPAELKPLEPAKRMRRTRKAEPEPSEVSTTAETPIVESLNTHELVCASPKSRRGTQKSKEPVAEEESVSSSTDKPNRGRKGRQPSEVAAEVEEAEQGPKDDLPKVKPVRGRGKTAVQHDAADAVPAKRARRGTTVSSVESTEQDLQVFAEPVVAAPVKRGKRAAKTPASTEGEESKDNSTKALSNGIEDTQTSKRSVKWKAEFEVIEVTPLKTVRGRKTKSTSLEAESEPQKAPQLEEKAQPVKRARRGAKAEESTKTTVEDKEAETQPKTRRSRSAKK